MKSYCEKCDNTRTVTIKGKKESLVVKGDRIDIDADVAICSACGKEVFCLELDDKNLQLAYSIYREKHAILSPTQIASIRKKYMLSQRALGKLLEWGDITINRYEKGAIQDSAHNELLMLIGDPKNMREIFEKKGHLLNSSTREAVGKAIDQLIKNEIRPHLQESLEEYISFENGVDEYSGFNEFNLEKVLNIMAYIAQRTDGVFTTKLNKLLWYIDTLNFKENSVSMSGCAYIHDKYGPIPKNYRWLIAAAVDKGLLCEEEVCFSSGSGGIIYNTGKPCDESLFNQEEIRVMNYVINYFKDFNCEMIKERSHTEEAYLKSESKEAISYKYAANLSISLQE